MSTIKKYEQWKDNMTLSMIIALCRHYQSSMSIQLGIDQKLCFKSKYLSDGSTPETDSFVLQLHTTAGILSFTVSMRYWDECNMADEIDKAFEVSGIHAADYPGVLLQI